MKHASISVIITTAALIISACGAQATPTVNPVSVQNTAVAVAFTIVAQTQAAIPTATPVPPTETPTLTPLPTDTPLAIATLVAASATPAAGSNASGGDPCATRVLSAPKGESTIIRIANSTKVKVTVSLYLNETASHGECGWRSYVIDKNSDVVIGDLVQGCYNLWAWSDDPKSKFNVASDTSCINNPQKWTFIISSSSIKFTF